jgi:hypothetical protein
MQPDDSVMWQEPIRERVYQQISKFQRSGSYQEMPRKRRSLGNRDQAESQQRISKALASE